MRGVDAECRKQRDVSVSVRCLDSCLLGLHSVTDHIPAGLPSMRCSIAASGIAASAQTVDSTSHHTLMSLIYLLSLRSPVCA